MKLLPGGRIPEGARLRVSWYHSMLIYDSQVTVCMAEPALYEIFDREARLLIEKLHPNSVLLNMDEIRMGGTCRACRGRNMGELLGECITKEASILRSYAPSLQIYIWSDMLDPNHNAHGNYYLVDGDFTGSWDHVPKNLIMAVWGGEPREASLKFFAGRGSRTLVACYYDADDLKDVEGWLKLAGQTPKLRGFMYTTWRQKYSLLPAFGDLLRKSAPPPAAAPATTRTTMRRRALAGLCISWRGGRGLPLAFLIWAACLARATEPSTQPVTASSGLTYTNLRIADVPWSIHVVQLDRADSALSNSIRSCAGRGGGSGYAERPAWPCESRTGHRRGGHQR